MWIENIFWYYFNIVSGLRSCTVSTGSFPGVKWPERGAVHAPPSSAEVADVLELYLLPSMLRISRSWGDLYLLPRAYIGFCNIIPVATGRSCEKFAKEVTGSSDEPTENTYIYIYIYI